MSWKKILFLCLSFTFIFGGMFGFANKANAQYATMLVPQNNTDTKTVLIGNSGGPNAQTNWGSDTSSFSRTDNVKTNIWYDSSKYVVSEFSVGTYNSQNKSFGSDKRIVVLQNKGNSNPNNKFEGIYSVNSNGQATKINSYQNGQGDTINQPTTQADLTAITTMERKKSLESAGIDPYSQNADDAKNQAATQTNQTRESADQASNPPPPKATITCEGNAFGIPDPLCVIAVVANNIILSSVFWITGVAGFIFDKIITFSVLEMGKNVQIGPGQYLSEAWTIMRDVVNIAFIFVLLYIGIMTIIKGFESGTSKMIAAVVVVALIINFSLFFTKIIIDGSNIIAVNFYQTIQSQTASGTAEWSGIAGAFLNTLKMGTINDSLAALVSDQGKAGVYLNIIKVALGGVVILLVLAVVLFIASIMFITRYIILIFVLVTSAAAIGSWILPSLKKSIYDKWWGALIGQSFFAPIFLFFMFLSLQLTQGLVNTILGGGANLSWGEVFQGDPSSAINLVVMYLVVVGFMIGSIIISKSLSDMAGSGAGKITAMVGGGALGVAGFAGRQSFGRLGQAAANSSTLQNFASKSRVGMGLLKVSNKVAAGSYDARNAKGFGKVAGATGVDLGKAGGEGGFQKIRTDAIKKRKDQYSTLGDMNENEKIRRDNLKKQLEEKFGEKGSGDLKIINDSKKKVKELEEELKGIDEKDAAHALKKADIAAEYAKIKVSSDKIKIDPLNKAIKAIDDAGEERQKTYLTAVGKRWFKANKIAAAEIRKSEEKKKNQTDIDKIISGIKS